MRASALQFVQKTAASPTFLLSASVGQDLNFSAIWCGVWGALWHPWLCHPTTLSPPLPSPSPRGPQDGIGRGRCWWRTRWSRWTRLRTGSTPSSSPPSPAAPSPTTPPPPTPSSGSAVPPLSPLSPGWMWGWQGLWGVGGVPTLAQGFPLTKGLALPCADLEAGFSVGAAGQRVSSASPDPAWIPFTDPTVPTHPFAPGGAQGPGSPPPPGPGAAADPPCGQRPARPRLPPPPPPREGPALPFPSVTVPCPSLRTRERGGGGTDRGPTEHPPLIDGPPKNSPRPPGHHAGGGGSDLGVSSPPLSFCHPLL